jgi:hypothetical protein
MVKVGKFWNLNLAPRHSSYWDSASAFSTMALKIKAICDLQHKNTAIMQSVIMPSGAAL